MTEPRGRQLAEAPPMGPDLIAPDHREDGEVDRFLTTSEVAVLFRVHAKTVARWARTGRITSVRTPGGHHRYWESEIRRMLDEP
jgi:excisionase family DNA binding protein